MKKLFFILAMVFALTACGTFGTTTVSGKPVADQGQVSFTQTCVLYDAALKGAFAAYQAGKLNPDQITQMKTISAAVSPLCIGPMPADAEVAKNKVVAATTTLAVYEALLKGATK